jgi:hypothetical protein
MGQKGSVKGRRRAFERLLAGELSGASGGVVWNRAEYSFKFAHEWEDCRFARGGRRLYITSCEALHLYQRLILGKKQTACTSRSALRGMRRRFGEGFLLEYLPVQKRSPCGGRKSDFEREVDGSFYKRVFDKYQKGEK